MATVHFSIVVNPVQPTAYLRCLQQSYCEACLRNVEKHGLWDLKLTQIHMVGLDRVATKVVIVQLPSPFLAVSIHVWPPAWTRVFDTLCFLLIVGAVKKCSYVREVSIVAEFHYIDHVEDEYAGRCLSSRSAQNCWGRNFIPNSKQYIKIGQLYIATIFVYLSFWVKSLYMLVG